MDTTTTTNTTDKREKPTANGFLLIITICIILMTVSTLYDFFQRNNFIQVQSIESEFYKEQVSSTEEYAAWVKAQSAVEPYDLYDDLCYAYEQYSEMGEGTQKYKTALALLVPSSQQNDLKEYNKILKRYFGASSRDEATNRFIDDLVKAGLLENKGNDLYSWNTNTLNLINVKSKLNLTTDVANALMGLLRTMDWDVR